MNKLLQRQINKYIGADQPLSDNFLKLLSVISDSYDHYEKDRQMLERSIELSSEEMIELNNNLRKEIETNQQHLTHLEASQRIAKVGSWELHIDVNNSGTKENLKAIYLSEETYRLMEIEPGTPVSIPLFFSRVHPEDAEYVARMFGKAITESSLFDIEYRIVTPSHPPKTVHALAEISFDENRDKLLVKGTVQDISDRKETDEQLQKANRELRTLFDNMQEVFYSIDMESYQLLQMSPACKKMYGYDLEEFEQNPNLWLEVILEEDKPIIYNNYAVLDRGETVVQQYRARRKDGDIIWIETRLQPTLNEQGKVVRLDGLNTDITQKKETEMALKQNDAKFRFLIQHSIDAIMVLNEQLEVSFASDSLYRIMGYSPEEVLGQKTLKFILADDMQAMQEHIQRVMDNPGMTFTIVYRRIKKDGTWIWCEGLATNLLHEPAIKGIVVNFRDITERKVYEDALKASNVELKKSNSELDRFVYSVSHDLRAPLSSMLGVVEMSESDTVDELMLKHLGMLKKSINKLDGFISDILDYSRNARGTVEYETLNFRELINEVVHNLKFMDAGNKLVKIKLDIDSDISFCTDRSRMSIILNNLISNAIRYSNPKTPEPYVAVSVKRKGDILEMEIEDNGLGISSDKQDKVFEMFYRVSHKSAGSGLGLYIVKETVEKLHGAIHLNSELNKGTTFKIILPALGKTA